MTSERDSSVASTQLSRAILGHPSGLATLFLTEMWERFTYYGMRAILILFLVTAVSDGGLGIDDRTASAIYGLYIAATYVFSPLGGWIGDRLIGAQHAVIGGGLLILIGNTLLVAMTASMFFLGLLVIVLGVGLLKPNVTVLVAHLYPEGGSRRDAGFSIFFMGINVGALLGGLLVPLFAARFGWRWGFCLPAGGMLLGLAQFMLSRHRLGDAGVSSTRRGQRRSWLPVILVAVTLAIVVALAITGRMKINAVGTAQAASRLIALLAAAYFVYLIAFARLSTEERRRVYALVAVFAAMALFYAGSEQAGASLNLFAERYTDRALFGWQMPAGMLQGTTSLYVILFAPAFAALWIALGRRGVDPSPPMKFAVGFVLLSLAFVVMYVASHHVIAGEKVLPTWLIVTYLLMEWGDLCLSPVALSWMSQLAPQRYGGQVMGLFYLAIGLGDNLAGQLSMEYDANNLYSLPKLFLKIVCFGLIGAVSMLLLAPVLKRFTSKAIARAG